MTKLDKRESYNYKNLVLKEVNIYDNGTVNFQGKPNEKLKKDIVTYIEIVNKKDKKWRN